MKANLPYPHSFPTKEETAFLQMALASDETFPTLWQKWKNSVDWYQIDFATAKLLSFFYRRLQALGIRDDFSDRIKGAHKSAWAKNQLFLHAAKEIAEICREAGIPILMLKGIPLVLEVYRDSGSRPLGDADILVHPEDGKRLTDILLTRGWHFGKEWAAEKNNPSQSVYKVVKATELLNNRGIGVDVHYNIFAADHGVRVRDVFLLKDLPSLAFPEYFWRHAVPLNLNGVPCLRLSNEDTLIHLIVHGSEGNTYRGFRWVLDTILLMQRMKIDWDQLLQHAKEFGYVVELKLAFSYLTEHFDVPVPAPFMQHLMALPVKKEEVQRYYEVANIEHTKRLKLLGNIPLLWYAYWKYEPGAKLYEFPRYVRAAWGLASNRALFGFAAKHYRRKVEGRYPDLFKGVRGVFRDSTYTVAGKALSFAASFAVVTVLARFVPREVIGSYNYVIAALAIIGITTLPGMNDALTRAVGRGHDGSVRRMIRHRLLYGMVGSLIAAGIGVFTWVNGDMVLGATFLIAAPFVPIINTFVNFTMSFWQGKKKFGKSALLGAIYYLGLSAITIPVVMYTQDLRLIVAGVLLAQALMGFAIYRSIIEETHTIDPDSVKLGVHLTVMQACGILANNVDKIILWSLFGPAMLAVYAFAATPISKVYQMLPISTVALPYLSTRMFTKETKRDILQKTGLLFLLSIPLTALIILIAPPLYAILFPLYPDSVPYFQLLFLGVALSPIMLIRSALIAFKKTEALYITEVGMPAVRIVLMAVGAYVFGIYGLIGALLMMSVLNFSVTLGLFFRAKTAV